MNIRREERKVICIHRYEKKRTENANSQYWKALAFKNAIIITYYSKQLQRRALKRHIFEKYFALIENPLIQPVSLPKGRKSRPEYSRFMRVAKTVKMFNRRKDYQRNMDICISY